MLRSDVRAGRPNAHEICKEAPAGREVKNEGHCRLKGGAREVKLQQINLDKFTQKVD
jgi:hypothetical protein